MSHFFWRFEPDLVGHLPAAFSMFRSTSKRCLIYGEVESALIGKFTAEFIFGVRDLRHIPRLARRFSTGQVFFYWTCDGRKLFFITNSARNLLGANNKKAGQIVCWAEL